MPMRFARSARPRSGIVTPTGGRRAVDVDGRPRPRAAVTYSSPAEAVDDPRRWESEDGYFGIAPAPAPAPARPSWQAALEQIVPAAISLATQRRLDKLQLERQRQGLPLLTATEIREQMAPAARIEHTLPQFDWKVLILPGALTIAGLVAVFGLSRRGR